MKQENYIVTVEEPCREKKFLGFGVLVVFAVLGGNEDQNKYGPDPIED